MFQFTKKNDRLVKWAMPDELIPLRCGGCGAVFITINAGPLGETGIYYGDDPDKCRECGNMGHKIVQLVPNKKLYNQGVWR